MSYSGISIILICLLAIVSAGWYFIFKRFEKRMSSRFNDLVNRSEESLKSFGDVLDFLGTMSHNLEERNDFLAERVQAVKIEAEKILNSLNAADNKLDIVQGLSLLIKQDIFLDFSRELGKSLREQGQIDEKAMEKIEELIKELKLENYSSH